MNAGCIFTGRVQGYGDDRVDNNIPVNRAMFTFEALTSKHAEVEL